MASEYRVRFISGLPPRAGQFVESHESFLPSAVKRHANAPEETNHSLW